MGSADRPETLVVVWPTCARGYLLVDRVDDAFITRWTLTKHQFADLERLHRDFHLGHHDLIAKGGALARLTPCPEALLRLAQTRRKDLYDRLISECSRLLRSAA